MQPKDKLNKAAWNQVQSIRDNLVRDVSNSIRDGKIKVDPASIQQLLTLVSVSVEAGYHQGYNVFNREIDAILKETSDDRVKVVAAPTKKK